MRLQSCGCVWKLIPGEEWNSSALWKEDVWSHLPHCEQPVHNYYGLVIERRSVVKQSPFLHLNARIRSHVAAKPCVLKCKLSNTVTKELRPSVQLTVGSPLDLWLGFPCLKSKRPLNLRRPREGIQKVPTSYTDFCQKLRLQTWTMWQEPDCLPCDPLPLHPAHTLILSSHTEEGGAANI